jgi:hypothetical protein
MYPSRFTNDYLFVLSVEDGIKISASPYHSITCKAVKKIGRKLGSSFHEPEDSIP